MSRAIRSLKNGIVINHSGVTAISLKLLGGSVAAPFDQSKDAFPEPEAPEAPEAPKEEKKKPPAKPRKKAGRRAASPAKGAATKTTTPESPDEVGKVDTETEDKPEEETEVL